MTTYQLASSQIRTWIKYRFLDSMIVAPNRVLAHSTQGKEIKKHLGRRETQPRKTKQIMRMNKKFDDQMMEHTMHTNQRVGKIP